MHTKHHSLLFCLLALTTGICSHSISYAQDTLDFNRYLMSADGENIYPSDRQIEMLRPLLPAETYIPAPAYTDRVYWNRVAVTESGKQHLNTAIEMMAKTPEVPISDEVYREANKQGNRGMYKPKYYRTMERLEYFILAECIENKRRFLPVITTYIRAIMSMKSWLHPNHDDAQNSNLEGKSVSIDLGARKFGSVLALANILLADKLPPDFKHEIFTIANERIIASYLNSCSGRNNLNPWIKGTSNWNSVCTSGALFVILACSDDMNQRLAAVGSALNSMKYYLSGFGNDGYCSEGAGYWSYGFGHYLYMAKVLYDYTAGKINLFNAGNPEKMKNIGNFIQRFEIQNGSCAPFADGVSSLSGSGSNFAHVMSSIHYGAERPAGFIKEEAAEQLIAWNNPANFAFDEKTASTKPALPDYFHFDDFGMVISRGKQNVPFSMAVKAGHNAENHNHDDVGTYAVFLGNDLITGDIGAPSYTAGAFSKDNPARSSWGHPVPMVNNKLQSNGRAFSGKIIATEFNYGYDKVVMDIKPAYEASYLKKLVRTMENKKSGDGTISIKDEFASDNPIEFGVAIMTFSSCEIINDTLIILTSEKQQIAAEITANGAPVKITSEVVPVKALRQGGTAYRIGVNFTRPAQNGSITVKYSPVFRNQRDN